MPGASFLDRLRSFVKEAFVRVVPRDIRSSLIRRQIRGEKREFIEYLQRIERDEEMNGILEYLPSATVLPYPYAWTETAPEYKVYRDGKGGPPYTILDGKRCYFSSEMTTLDVFWAAAGLNGMEQHPESPHLYLTSEFDVADDDIVVDCGAAEGNFGLSVIDRVKKLYLFEPEEKWLEPLRKTFEPWADKVEIVQKYISDTESDDAVTLDGFFMDKEQPTFLKMDLEGYERNALKGAENILRSSVRKAIVCTYHLVDDHEVLSEIMKANGFRVTTSNGYMYTRFDGKEPYLRRVLIRCVKQ